MSRGIGAKARAPHDHLGSCSPPLFAWNQTRDPTLTHLLTAVGIIMSAKQVYSLRWHSLFLLLSLLYSLSLVADVDAGLKEEPGRRDVNASASGGASGSSEEMGPFGYLSKRDFIIACVVFVVLFIILVTLLIVCCCCGHKTTWADLTPAEKAAGLTPSHVDAGITLSQIIHPAAGLPPGMPPVPGMMPAPYGFPSPIPPGAPVVLAPTPVPVADAGRTSSSESLVQKKRKKDVQLPKGFILPKALEGVKPKNKKAGKKGGKGRKKGKRKGDDDEDEDSDD